jgi:hypothetical protein
MFGKKVLTLEEIHNSIIATKNVIKMEHQKHISHNCYANYELGKMLSSIDRIISAVNLIMSDLNTFGGKDLDKLREDVTEYLHLINRDMDDDLVRECFR